jgi:hypothetical protein
LTAAELLNGGEEAVERAGRQRDDVQAATISDLVATLQASPQLTSGQEQNLVAYIGCLPRDLRFGLIKSLLKIPPVAQAISQDMYDTVVFDAIRAMSAEAQL